MSKGIFANASKMMNPETPAEVTPQAKAFVKKADQKQRAVVTIRMPDELMSKIDAEAASLNISRSAVINVILSKHFMNQD